MHTFSFSNGQKQKNQNLLAVSSNLTIRNLKTNPEWTCAFVTPLSILEILLNREHSQIKLRMLKHNLLELVTWPFRITYDWVKRSSPKILNFLFFSSIKLISEYLLQINGTGMLSTETRYNGNDSCLKTVTMLLA